MNRLKQIARMIAEVMNVLNSPGVREEGEEFVENIRENVKISIDLAKKILEIVEMDTGFLTRGINNALEDELVEELKQHE